MTDNILKTVVKTTLNNISLMMVVQKTQLLNEKVEIVMKGRNTQFLKDGVQKIDYILAYRSDSDVQSESTKRKSRERFLKKLKKRGLIIETDAPAKGVVSKHSFLKPCQ